MGEMGGGGWVRAGQSITFVIENNIKEGDQK
jgi:hypothetical protein